MRCTGQQFRDLLFAIPSSHFPTPTIVMERHIKRYFGIKEIVRVPQVNHLLCYINGKKYETMFEKRITL